MPETTQPRVPLPAAALLAVSALALAARLATATPFPESVDAVYFQRGIVRYAVPEQRPHWPGYPVYVWAGKAVRVLDPDPTRALHLLSYGATVLTLWPLAAACASLATLLGFGASRVRAAAVCAALLWAASPGGWIVAGEISSDATGLLLAAGILALACRAELERDARPLVWASLLGGAMLGTRLAYLPLLGPLVLVALRQRAVRVRGVPLLVALGAAFALPVLGWLSWQLCQDGWGFVAEGGAHLRGHMDKYGRTAATDTAPLTRPIRLARTLWEGGLGGPGESRGALRLACGFATLALAAVGAARLRRSVRAASLLAAFALPYALGVAAGHDVELPRYALPLVPAVALLAGLGLPRGRWTGPAAAAGAAAAMLAVSAPLAREHQAEPPVGYSLAAWAASRGGLKAVIIGSDLQGVRVFVEEREELRGVVAAPDRVGETAERLGRAGFTVISTAPDPLDPGGWRAAAHFTRSRALDPRGPNELWAYVRDASASRSASISAPGRLDATP